MSGSKMGLISRFLLLGVFGLTLATRATAQQANPPSPTTGLIFATPQQLQGIPVASMPFSGATLPASVDLSGDLPRVGDQGNQRSCVGWATAYALKTYQERVESRWLLEESAGLRTDRIFSPAFIYNQINSGRDGGAQFVDALNLLTSAGAATLADMPYVETDFVRRPSDTALQNAKLYRVDYWRRVNAQDTQEVKAQLNAGYPVLIGADVYDNFVALSAGATWQQTSGANRGGHAMVVVGYDDSKNAFRVVNSWGTRWSSQGFGWIDYMLFRQVVREAFIVKDATNGPAPEPTPTPNPRPPQPGPSPAPRPTPLTQSAFNLTSVQHNIFHPAFGAGMQLGGTLNVPPGSVGYVQVVIQIRFNSGGAPGPAVRALVPSFSLPNGNAATATPPLLLQGGGFQTAWTAFLPYQALAVSRGHLLPSPAGPVFHPVRSELVALPGLFLDQFSIAQSQPVPFYVAL